MPLPELQAAFREAILEATVPEALAALVEPGGIAPERRLAIYRNNSFVTLAAALKATYPAVCRLVHERFFDYAADAFIRAHPPRSPCLAAYGAAFADFLAGFPPARRLAYLPDLARLEWAVNEAWHAPDAPPLDPAAIAALPPTRYPDLRFRLHPTCRLLESVWPVEEIWRANRDEAAAAAAGSIDLEAGGCRLLLHRREEDVLMRRLDPPGFAFLLALRDGTTLADAYEAAAAVGAFDPTAALRDHLAGGIFAGLAEPQEGETDR